MNTMTFICSPYGGKPENIALARRFMRMAVAAGMVPISLPVMLHGILDDHNPEQRKAGMEAGHEIMRLCGWMWICGNTITPGMQADREAFQKTLGLERWVFMADLEEWEART